MRRSCLALFLALAACGAARAEKTYELRKSDAKAAVGVQAVTSVTIVAAKGWHVNEDFPTSLKLSPDAGIAVAKPKLTKPDLKELTKDQLRFDVAFTASEAGRKSINAEARFAMCQEKTCIPIVEKVVLAVEATPKKK